jgi:STE24 endopeptidase
MDLNSPSLAPSVPADPILDADQQDKARALARARRKWQLVDLVIGNGYFLALLLTGGAVALRDWAFATAGNWWGAFALFNLIFWSGYMLLTMPLGYVGGYRLERQYGLSKQTVGQWLVDAFKGLVVGAVVSVPLLAGVYALLGSAPGAWWLWAWGGYAVFTLIAIVLVPVVIMPLFHKFTPLEDEALVARLHAMAARADAKVAGVFRWGLGEKSTQANAALTGFGATRRIIISDTMLDGYSPDEIEAVLAHELGHQVHADIGRFWIVNVAIALGALYVAHRVLSYFATAGGIPGLKGIGDFANLPLLLLVVSAASLCVLPLVNGYSRRREHAADGFALRLASRPEALATALTKLAGQNLADPYPPAWIEWLLYSHPALGKRVARIQQSLARLGVAG